MYYISLDIGDASGGWCVLDEAGNLIKCKRKNMWGVRLFTSALSAEKCRINRSTRRRLGRRRTRIIKLREIMGDMVNSVDSNFFARLDEAFLQYEDKSVKATNILFNDSEFTDADYYEKNKTIYHWRKELIDSKEKMDPRIIYLAIHHILKYRGNFLYQGQKLETIENVQMVFEELLNSFKDCDIDVPGYNNVLFANIENVLKTERKNKDTKEKIVQMMTKEGWDKKISSEFINAILGYSYNVSVIMQDDTIRDDDGKVLKIKFGDSKFEEEEEKYKSLLDDKYCVIEGLNKIYGWFVLQKIIGGKKYISEAMVAKYNKHSAELLQLKGLFKKYASKEEYRNFFHKEVKEGDKYVANYANYIKGMKRCGKNLQEAKVNLYEEIQKTIGEKAKDDQIYREIVQKMEQEDFLSKQNEISNSYIPYQLNLSELEVIIDNQKKYYPELQENKELLIKMLTSRIPYYVGPLNTYKGIRAFSWMNKKVGMEKEKVYPWNVEDVVDIDSTAEKFITRMTNYCTYLPDEKVLPKKSLLYQRYEVLQELSQIQINNKRLGKIDRDQIIKDLFEKNKIVKEEHLKGWLVRQRFVNKDEKKDYIIKGYQKENEFASSLSSYITFKKIFGYIDSSNEEMVEEIIYWLTVFDEKTIVKRKIQQRYGEKVSEKQLNQIVRLNFTGWGRMSAKFLNGIKGVKNTTILEMLEEPDERFNGLPNMMQIINKDEKIKEIIEENRKKYDGTENLLDVINDMYTSPANKRGIWQCMSVIEEIKEIMQEKPQQIFIEFAREDGKKERTSARKVKIEKALHKLKEEFVDEYDKDKLNELKSKSEKLNEEKIYLYFMQNGKSLYTGKTLHLDTLEEYEVDHIIPQSMVDDDSLDNKALVLKSENQIKGNRIVSGVEYKDTEFTDFERNLFWERLYKVGLMTPKKLSNLQKENVDSILTRGFINRQLVETRQIVKNVANLIQDYYQNEIKVIEVKADLSNSIRKKYSREKIGNDGYWLEKTSGNMFFKNRELNDYHHVHDAYLAAIIGIYIQRVYPNWTKELDYSNYKKIYRKHYEDNKDVSNRVIFQAMLGKFDKQVVDEDTGEVIWDGPNIVAKINSIFCYRDYYVSRKVEEGTGAFYDETIYAKGNSDKLIPLKKGLSTQKYGGYKGGEKAYFSLIRKTKGKKRKLEFVEIPVYIAKAISQGRIEIDDYIRSVTDADNIDILRRKVQKYQLIELENGELYYLVSASEVINAKQLILGGKNQKYNRLISHLSDGSWKKMNPDNLKRDMQEFYVFIQEKIEKEYLGFWKTMEKIVQTNAFEQMNTENQAGFLVELLKLTKANSEYPVLGKFKIKGLVDRMGRKNKFIFGNKIILIDRSVTGIHERRTCYELEDSGDKKPC